MPRQPWMKLISVDDHLIEHPMVWQDRLPQKYRERGPRIVEVPRGNLAPVQSWVYEDRVYPEGAFVVVVVPVSAYPNLLVR